MATKSDMEDFTLRDKMRKLAYGFPFLRGRKAIDNWDIEALDSWATGGASKGEKHTIQFLLQVWDHHTDWACGKFEVMEVINLWDQESRENFLAWAKNPWWA